MLAAVVVVYLFGLGPLVLVGLWRIDQHARRAAVQRRLQARRLVRVSRRIVRIGKIVTELAQELREERSNDEAR